MITLFLALCTCQTFDVKAKTAFDKYDLYEMEARIPSVIIAKNAFDKYKCTCQNCDCIDCKCTDDTCDCVACNSFDAIYKKAIKDQQIIVLAINAPKIDNPLWKIIELKSITGEKPGYIVGVPKNGQLIRLDFPPIATRQRIRLDVLHVYYPLTAGYIECPTCPQGRIKRY